MRRIYLDHNATTRPHPAAVEEMVACLNEGFGNPSSIHWFGQEARRLLDRARQRVAGLLGAGLDEIVFTSGGTEADNHALLGAASARAGRGRHIVSSLVEHQAVLNPLHHLERQGWSVTYVRPDADGRVDPAAVEAALRPDTALVSLMLANNEVGTLQPVAEVAALARARGILVHTDAVQAVGKIPVDVRALGVDLLSASSHKLHGPKGAGVLYVRRGVEVPPLLMGGHHEQHRRAGTENLPAIVGFGKACELAAALADRVTRVAAVRDRLERGIRERFPDARVNGHPASRLPNTLNVTFPGLDGELALMSLDLLGIAVSTSAACSSGTGRPSHVLLAMGRSAEEAHGSLRFSLGDENSEEEIDLTLDALARALPGLGGAAP